MKKLRILLGGSLCMLSLTAVAQKTINEATIKYDLVIQIGNNAPQPGDPLAGANSTLYIKGNNTRSELISPLGKEVSIYNARNDDAVILKEFSGQKLMITLSKNDWNQKNRAFLDIEYKLTGESKNINGYNTKKANAKTADGKTFEVYYTTDLVPANKDYDPTFHNLPGLPVQYEIETGKMKFKYTLSSITYDPVSLTQFDFPSSGYRVMTYQENQQLKKGN